MKVPELNSPQDEAQLHQLSPDVFEFAVFTQAAEQYSFSHMTVVQSACFSH